jgi:transposase
LSGEPLVSAPQAPPSPQLNLFGHAPTVYLLVIPVKDIPTDIGTNTKNGMLPIGTYSLVENGADMDLRELKALELAARAKIRLHGLTWLVPSQSSSRTYRVSLDPDQCDCEDWLLRQAPCKHVIAARLVRERDHDGKDPGVVVDAVPKKKTYAQNWPAYNLAQTTEKRRLQVLLADLCGGFPEPPHDKRGRKPISLSDRLFTVCFKVYCGMSIRRGHCDMLDAHERGYLSRPLHYSKVSALFTDPELTVPLRELVLRSALPLAVVETDFAVDSSGFSTSKFVRWFDEKYGVERSGHDWVKVHICVGVKTGVTAAVEIRDRDANDSPLLPPLVNATAEHFKVREVSADKGYLSVENVETIAKAGGLPFIAPKSNTTGNAGGLFERMFHYYQYRREDFLSHYHKRSNVESVFSAVKRKFGDAVRSRNETAMVNESLAKFVCNNLCCVILSQIELGIEADFWPKDDADQPRDVIRLPTRA